MIVYLHNTATLQDQVYGERLLYYIENLKRVGKLSDQDVTQIFLLSLDWPVKMSIDPSSVLWENFMFNNLIS